MPAVGRYVCSVCGARNDEPKRPMATRDLMLEFVGARQISAMVTRGMVQLLVTPIGLGRIRMPRELRS
jgi:hypothetical protein